MADNENPGSGIPQEPPPSMGMPQSAPPEGQGTNVLAIIGLVAGILAILLVFAMWIPVFGVFFVGAGLLLGTLAIVLSVMGRKAAYRGLGGQGVAMGGLILGIIGLVFSLVFGACQAVCFAACSQGDFKVMTQEERKEHEEMLRRFNHLQFDIKPDSPDHKDSKEQGSPESPEPPEANEEPREAQE